ncbi:MAG: Fe-S oxidoreductase [Methanomicrobiales archaeon HGW-Methanomicrobiales-4]|nr:MAG: Fe-S oxidoreductase [Methanomicrobiales archaeon HGW-Methanomicrobiales-4]
MTDPYLERELSRLILERDLLQKYQVEELAEIIKDVGFSCTQCGDCCTTRQNGHVFLLQSDTDRALKICSDSLIPAPFFEICDKAGRFYVSGYALRTKTDGSCVHLSEGRCRIYQDRFSICRIYPYMLHREPDEKGRLIFRQISGLNEHGSYHTEISDEECLTIAQETIIYEKEWLNQMISFYEAVKDLFQISGERHVRKIYDNQMREFSKGVPVQVFVYHDGRFISHTVSLTDYIGILPS